eukprot:2707721-Rhodomonas_salina.1
MICRSVEPSANLLASVTSTDWASGSKGCSTRQEVREAFKPLKAVVRSSVHSHVEFLTKREKR